MTSIQPQRSAELWRRHSRILRWSLLASLLAHVVVLLLFRSVPVPESPYAAAGPDADDARAAAGGGMQSVQLRYAPPTPPEAQPIPIPAPDIEELIPEPEPQLAIETPSIEMTGPTGTLGKGPAEAVGPGTATGTGRGDGGTADEGRFRVVPPSPRGLILPPAERPRGTRGKEVAVWVFVTARGDVVADSTRLIPSSGDRGFDRKLRTLASEWVFTPARRGGEPVAEWFQYVVVL